MPLLHDVLHHPRRLWLRRALFQIHLWAGVLLSLYLVIIGVTGSVLVFEDEFIRTTLPSSFHYRAGQSPELEKVIARAEAAQPGSRVTFIMAPQPSFPAYHVWRKDVAGKQAILLADPATGELVPAGHRSWIEWVHDLHVYLLMEPAGIYVNGAGAACLLLLTFTGLILWWPGLARWTRGFGVKLGAGWRRVNFDLHSAIGIWTLAIACWWGISGVYFAWPLQVGAAVNTIFPLKTMLPPQVKPEEKATGQVSLGSIFASARQATPGGFLSGVGMPASKGSALTIYMDTKEPGDFSHRDIHYFDPGTGRLLATWHYGQNQSLGDWILWAMHPLHFGTLWGLWAKVLWALLGLSLPALSVTGLLMYWNRSLRHRLRQAKLKGDAVEA